MQTHNTDAERLSGFCYISASLVGLPALRSNCLLRLRWDSLILPKEWVAHVADSIWSAQGT